MKNQKKYLSFLKPNKTQPAKMATCFVAIFLSLQVFAQTCGTAELHSHLMATDLAYKTAFFEQQLALDKAIENQQATASTETQNRYTIPVVVHVIHLGEAVGEGSNISDAQIAEGMLGLNDRFAKIVGAGADIEVDFCLASQAPDGSPSTGINRVDGRVLPNFETDGMSYFTVPDCGADEKEIKALSAWPVSDCYNIWIVHKICGTAAGFAYYPNGQDFDGMVVRSAGMKYTAWLIAHEMGHGFNLFHTFEGDGNNTLCPPNDDCSADGDKCCDTPPHLVGGCQNTISCDSMGVWENSKFNYMSYCSKTLAQGLFTEDQKTRIRASFNVAPRNTLLDSKGCLLPVMATNDPNKVDVAKVYPTSSTGLVTLESLNAAEPILAATVFSIEGQVVFQNKKINSLLSISPPHPLG